MSLDDFIKHVPNEDLSRIISSYHLNPHEGLPDDVKEFVYHSMRRIYTETCMEPERKSQERILERFGMSGFNCVDHSIIANGLLDYIDGETHYYINDALKFRWDEKKKEFDGLSTGPYQYARGRVIEAFVKNAIEFFKGEPRDRIRDDKLNLRIDLKPLIK